MLLTFIMLYKIYKEEKKEKEQRTHICKTGLSQKSFASKDKLKKKKRDLYTRAGVYLSKYRESEKSRELIKKEYQQK